jgi:uncharacterized membrane protein/thiol-disulfide isomerase/thioredoxin
MLSIQRLRQLFLTLFATLSLFAPLTIGGQEPVVYGVFFFSPTCPHCHVVMTEHWPGIQQEFGDQLRVLFVDVSTEAGRQIMLSALTALNIDSNGVPMLLIGSQVLLGEIEIPQRAPAIIQTGLESGGIDLPDIPRINAIYQTALQQTDSAAVTVSGINADIAAAQPTVFERLIADPVANTLAVFVLALLVFSLYAAFSIFWGRPAPKNQPMARSYARFKPSALLLMTLLGLAMTLSLALGNDGHPAVLLLDAGVFIVFLMVGIVLARARARQALPGWLLPLVALAGIAVAAYLAYVELTLTDAFCGVVGNCNVVQQSPYARIFNIPIGVIGIVGYLLIVGAWLLRRAERFQAWADAALRALVLFGVAFSIYLTFLEPFVIGATCLWCLTSAVIMLLLLWLLAPSVSPAKASVPGKGRARPV